MACISAATAVVGGLGAGASLFSGITSANAAKSAAKIQAQAATLASENQLKMFEQTQANLSPYMTAGKGALGEVENLLGLPTAGGGPPQADAIQKALEATPGYQFTRDQGLKSVQNSYAAQGLGSSGAALRGAGDYVTGLANSTYEQRLADYLGLAGSGQNAAAGLGALGQQAAATAGGFSTSAAAAQAAGVVGSANALTSAISGIAGSGSNAALLLALNNAGMFGGGATAGGTASQPNALAPVTVTPSALGGY